MTEQVTVPFSVELVSGPKAQGGMRIAAMTLPDGTMVGRVMTQFGDTEEGFSAYLTFYFPGLLPEETAEGHSQHAAVEFRNWMVAATEAKQGRRNQ